MHFLGLAGMPRRIPDYPDAFTQWNQIASFGSSISAVSFLLFIFIFFNAFSNYNPLKTITAKNYIGLNKFFKSRNSN
jgi:heme/copper-type cytochrome/quinol oxidase subunit 1